MDTPRSNLGDATYLGRPPPDFDMTQEPSFQSPSKDNNLLQQLRNGRAPSLRTPRGSRAPLGDRRNLPAGIGGSEFTPMLKSATRNSARRRGKENTNGLATPALGKIDEDMDMTNVPVDSSLFGPSRNMSYVTATPLPEVEASSTASTPLVQPTRRGGDKGPLQDGNQLSLREQENVIDKIEKENFGLKLKIHFLEEALRKTGPGFSEAALKENTELKVDKVTMQRELSKYKKHLASAEKDLETYQQQILDVQEKAKKKYADQSQKAENEALRRRLEEGEAEIGHLRRQLQQQSQDDNELNKLRDEIAHLETDLRTRDREVNKSEEEIDQLQRKLEEREAEIARIQRQLQQQSQDDNDVNKLRDEVANLEADLHMRDREVNESEEQMDELHRKLEEKEAKIGHLQRQLQQQSQDDDELVKLRDEITHLEASLRAKDREASEGEEEIDELQRKLEGSEAEIGRLQQLRQQSQDDGELVKLRDEITHLEANLRAKDRKVDEGEEDINKLRRKLEEIGITSRHHLEEKEVKISRLQQQLQQQSQDNRDLDGLRDKMEHLEADLRARDREINEGEEEIGRLRRKLEEMGDSSRRHLEDKEAEVNSLQRQLQQQSRGDNKADQLRREVASLEADLRAKGHEANEYKKQIGELRRELETKQSASVSLHSEVSGLRDNLRQSQADRQVQSEKLEALENKIKVLQATLDEESGDASQRLRQADELCQDLRRQLHEQAQRTDRLGQLEGADKIADELRRELETKQSAIVSLRSEVSGLRDDIRRSEDDRQVQSDKIEALEDEVEVLQATLDEESEDASQRLRQADELCQDLRRQLREQVQRTNRLSQLEGADKVAETLRQQLEQAKQNLRDAEQECEDADRVAEMLRQQLEEIKQSLHDAEQECEELKQKFDGASRQESREVTQANRATEDLKRQLLRAQKESKKAELLCEDLRAQLDAAKQEPNYVRQKLDRARRECAEYQASAEKLQFRNERLEKAVQEALAWIQAKNAEKPNSVAPGPTKQAAVATFRYGDVVMDVIDRNVHDEVIRTADEAQRRHKKEIRGMALQMEWMQARWERESRLRNDGAFAKTFLQLQLDIADGCNKAQLRRLNRIHQDLGIKSPAELLVKREKDRKAVNKLKVCVSVVRAMVRMRVDARKWGEHEKTRLRLDAAWEEQKQKQVLC